jgi:hypothetical protein
MHSHSRPSWAQPGRARASGVPTAIAGRQHQTPPPVLASEVLREDLAPIEPGRLASRFWGAGAAVVLVAVGLCLRWDLGVSSPVAETVCFAVAAAQAATAVVPLSYLWRAMVGASVCLAAVVLGLLGGGPLALLTAPGLSGPWAEIFRLVAAVVLPAAILFRSHYRAYGRGRVLLAVAFALAIPFLINEGALFVQAESPVAQIGPGTAIAIVLLTVFAFVGAPATSVTAVCAVVLGISIALDIGMRQAYLPPPTGSGPLSHALTAAAFVACTSPIAMGLFQLLSAIYAHEARLVDVRQPPVEDAAPPSLPPDSIGRP